jgi:hypothetical protein
MCQRSVNYTSSRTEYLTVATLAFEDPTSKSIRNKKDESVQDQLVDYSYIIIEGLVSMHRIFSDGIIVLFLLALLGRIEPSKSKINNVSLSELLRHQKLKSVTITWKKIQTSIIITCDQRRWLVVQSAIDQ